jgi:hypothetical protein
MADSSVVTAGRQVEAEADRSCQEGRLRYLSGISCSGITVSRCNWEVRMDCGSNEEGDGGQEAAGEMRYDAPHVNRSRTNSASVALGDDFLNH